MLTNNSPTDECKRRSTVNRGQMTVRVRPIRQEPVPDVDWLMIALDQDRGDEHLSTEYGVVVQDDRWLKLLAGVPKGLNF